MGCFLFLFIYIINLLGRMECVSKLQEHFSWRALDYEYPTNYERTQALLTKRFVPENNLPVGIEIWKDKLFVTVPRWRVGIPSTLNYVPLHTTKRSPKLIPYPDWKSNELGNCESGLSTVYRLKADECDRLWVLDTGTFGIANTTQNPCPYALNIFDLTTNQRILRYELRPEDTNPNTFIANIAVDVGSTCNDAFAYLSDELGYGLIVYSLRENRSWRFSHGFFMPDPLTGDFTIDGLNFQWSDEGVFGMALSPRAKHRTLFFSPLASHTEFAVSTSTLKNSSKVEGSYHEFYVLGQRGRRAHTTARVMDPSGVQLFNLIDRNAVGCWNSASAYKPENIGLVDQDDERLIFPSDVKIDANGFAWVLSDRMSNFLLASLDFADVNFRVFFAPINVLIAGTVCEVSHVYDYLVN